MPAADIAKTAARVLWLIGARNTANSFDTTVGNDNFILEEVQRALVETESEVFEDLAETKHPMAVGFLAWSADLDNGDSIPAHFGEIDAVQIKYYSGASVYNLAESTSRENIRRWRENYNSIFDAVAHNANGSGLSGFFNLTNSILTFTGYKAQAKIYTFTPNYATPAHQIANNFSPNLICGAIPKLLKIGVPLALAGHYDKQYMDMKMLIRQGHSAMPEINEAQKVE